MINIPVCDYEVSKYTNSYHDNNTIGLYLSANHDLSDTEQDTYISDTLTHEYIHHVLEAMFKPEVTYLFDCIGDTLRDISLLRRVIHSKCIKLDNIQSILWSDMVSLGGVDSLLNAYYWISKENVYQILKEGC